MNTLKTFLFLTVLTLLFIWLGGAIGGENGMVAALFFACIMNFASYWTGDRIVLAMYGAKPVNEAEGPEIYGIVRRLAQKAGVPMPKVYIIPSEAPNAFATGRNPGHAAVAVTEGILKILNEDELSGVLAHELSHVRNRDILISTVAATIAGAISMLANMAKWPHRAGGSRDEDSRANPVVTILVMMLVPIAAFLIQLAISRSREFVADEGGAEIEGNPDHLASALEKLEQAKDRTRLDANPSMAHMFIVNPLSGNFFMKLFSTHPPTEERIARLRAMQRAR